MNNKKQKTTLTFDSNFLSWEFKKRRLPPKNIVQRLIRREIFHVNPNVSPFIAINKFHQNLLPNFSVENIEKPNCFLRKFTYDGRYLLAFSSDQTSVEIYEYQGASAAAHLLQNISSIGQDSLNIDDDSVLIKKQIFNSFFQLKHIVNVATNGEQLNRECSLFTENHKFVIVVSASLTNEEQAVFYDQYQNNESLPIGTRTGLEDYTVHLVDIENGLVLDRRTFKTDKIYLSYNHGIYMYNNTLAILSVQHQTIHIFQISPTGQFINVRKVGRFCFEDDEYIVQKMTQPNQRPVNRNNSVHPFREVPFNSLKHRLLVFLFKYAKFQSSLKMSNLPIKQFYHNFNFFSGLRIWKMQLLDEEHILIKYEQEESLFNRVEMNYIRNWNLFVVYNLRTSEIVNVYPQFSEEFLYVYENLCDYFRHPSYYICSPANNTHARQIHEHFKRTIMDAKNGSHMEAVKMILSTLPLNAQSYSPSPYLDLSLFSYDEKSICVNEKPRQCTDIPIRFYARDSGRLLFKLHTGQLTRIPSNSRRLVAFIFHPTDPFIVSIQRSNSQYTVNFHIRHFNPI